jgi:hypothetical protein
MHTFSIERKASYFGRTTPRIEYTVRRSDGRSFGTYSTLRRAKEEMALYAPAPGALPPEPAK